MCNRTIDQSKAETREITMLIEIVQVRAHRLYIYICMCTTPSMKTAFTKRNFQIQ